MQLTDLLSELLAKDGSDIHLVADQVPYFRIAGELVAQTQHPILDRDQLAALLAPHLTTKQQAILETGRDVETSVRTEDRRFRLHVFRERGSQAACIRAIPAQAPTLDSLDQGADTYPVFQSIIKGLRGLVLVVGPTGSGKSTTIAAMIEEINRTRTERIVTIEDPITYEFESKKSLITQRVVGEDVAEFPAALRSAMQEDPDVVLISEMRDLETVLLALTLAETGHLVFTTLGVSSASEAVNRLISIWPEGQQSVYRRMLALNLHAIVAQRLVVRSPSAGRVAVNEILLNTPRVRQMILDGHTDLTVAIEAGRDMGMQTMDDCLIRLHEQGSISASTTWLHLTDKERLPHSALPTG